VDGEGVRAPMVAAWLRQLGHDACVLAGGHTSGLKIARAPAKAETVLPPPHRIEARALAAGLEAGTVAAFDLRASAAYRDAHIPGSCWSIRPRIAADASAAKGKRIVLIADEGRLARAAAIDLAEAGHSDVAILRGGIEEWRAEGLDLARSPGAPADSERIDFMFHTLNRNAGSRADAEAYLAWEVGLVDRLDAQERAVFKLWGKH
ncbi:MAG TPA: rhodanese-like domain-containing protein, partial [Hyphomicrobiaceae bacterium]|nr:rhodanese-like domain-containing protein [Hyphomicrobiaceae bacterium]